MENQDQNLNPTPPVSPVIQTPPNSKSKHLIIIAIIIALVILTANLAFGMFLYNKSQTKLTVKPTPTPIVQKQTPTPTSSGQTSLNKNNLSSLVSFNLPQGWTKNEGNMPIIRVIYGQSSDFVSSQGGTPTTGIFYIIGRNSFTPAATLEEDIQNIQKQFSQTTNFKKLQIGGYEGYSYDWSNQIRHEYLIRKGRDDWYIDFTIGENSSSNQKLQYERDINQILSTFKFTDSSVTPTPTCMPRPACLDATPRCMIAEPINGWCK